MKVSEEAPGFVLVMLLQTKAEAGCVINYDAVGSTEIYGYVTKISVRQKKILGHITKISVRQFFFNVSSQQLERAIPM